MSCHEGKWGVCEHYPSMLCIEKAGIACERQYETCTGEEHGYALGQLHFPPLRCPSCRSERRELLDAVVECGVCTRAFVVREMSRKYYKTHGMADPPEYIPGDRYGPECTRCRQLDWLEKEKIRRLVEFERQGILTCDDVARLSRSRNPHLLGKVFEGKLRPVDVARVVERRDRDGKLMSYTVRRYRSGLLETPGRYNETYDPSGSLIMVSHKKGNAMVHYDPNGRKVGETFWQPSTLWDWDGHYVTFGPDGKKTSETYEEREFNRTIRTSGEESFSGASRHPGLGPRELTPDASETAFSPWLPGSPRTDS